MGNSEESTKVSLEVFDWQWDESDRDANFKREVAMYSHEDPMPTLETMSRYLAIPVGAIIRYLLVKWAASGSAALLELGPRVVQQMADIVAQAENAGTDQERLEAYRKLSQVISWLSVPLNDAKWRSGRRNK